MSYQQLSKSTRVAWRKFIASEAGQEGMLFLEQLDPTIGGEDANAIVFSAGRAQGYKDAIRTIPKLLDISDRDTQDEENS